MIELAIRKPVTVAVGVILVVLFGALSLVFVPVQLTPDVVKPQITIETLWRGASPHEIEREIIEEQEEQLKGVEGVWRMTSESFDDMGRITLEFPPGTDMDAALIRVSNRLEQVPEYPENAEKPVIRTSSPTENAMAWFMLARLPGNDREIESYYTFADDVIKPRLERVQGVGQSNIFGGREEEVQVIVDPEALAARGIPVTEVIEAIRRENADVSAGDFDEGKRKYEVRTIGRFREPADLGAIVLEARDGRRVYLRDIAEIRLGLKKRDSFVRQRGEPTIAINAIRSPGANVLETMERLRAAVRELNEGPLRAAGLRMTQVYDETDYIHDAINNVIRNLALGSILAVAVLFLFLRSAAPTLIVALAIPVSVIGSFILMYLFGRTINVISLAGMSFASGMVVDNSIVSLENIFRLRQEGRSSFRAALEGARGVWGAILASTLTTIAVFVPILFVEERAGQLFRDIAIAISCSVGLSLIVAITVIPCVAARLLGRVRVLGTEAQQERRFARVENAVAALVRAVNARTWTRVAVVALLTIGSVGAAFAFLPPPEYLPQGNRNLAIGILLPPPGYNIEELSRLGRTVEARVRPLLAPVEPQDEGVAEAMPLEARRGRGGQAPAINAGAGSPPPEGELEPAAERLLQPPGAGLSGPRIRHFFFVARQNNVFMGAVAQKDEEAGRLVDVLRRAVSDIPGLIAVVQQASLFERGVASGRRVDIEITGEDLETLIGIGARVFGGILQLFPQTEGHQARPIPSLDLDTPEVHVEPDRARTRDLGIRARDIGIAVDAVIDGTKADDFMLGGREIDITLMGTPRGAAWHTQDVESIPIGLPDGTLVPLSTVARVAVTRGPQQINHVERRRAITIQFVPAPRYPLETAVEKIRSSILAPLQAPGALPPGYEVRLAGTVDDLKAALLTYRWNLALAVVITYLLLAALFESFFYPLVVLFSVPLAAVGGIVCLDLVHAFVPGVQLDILTMLGFVILVGVVVNNAILIVYQSLEGHRAGLDARTAVAEAVRRRVRPIFMTAATSGFGMLPLVVFPGAGSELYRGLGSVVVGGLFVSTIFTLVLIPALLSLVLERVGTRARDAILEEEAA